MAPFRSFVRLRKHEEWVRKSLPSSIFFLFQPGDNKNSKALIFSFKNKRKPTIFALSQPLSILGSIVFFPWPLVTW